MSDIEKVIKGLEECSKADFNPCMDRVCPYAPKNTNNFCDCRIHLLIDALELLKAQRETIDELISADKLLKEQEEKQEGLPPAWQDRTQEHICQKCGGIVWQEDNYCSKCGQAVKWNA